LSSSTGLAETQRQTSKRLGSKVTGRPYSALSRSASTSSCSAPTTPTIAAAPSWGRNTCTTPSSAICCSASRSFFAFIASASFTRRRISGAKLGTPRKTISSPSVSVSPMRSAVVGNADDIAGERLFGERAILGEEELRRRERDRFAGAHQLRPHAALSWPEQTRMKAMRSRWLGSMFAWILKTKPVIFGSSPRRCAPRRPAARRRREFGQRVDQVAHAEIA
jgi:hypothetical protein